MNETTRAGAAGSDAPEAQSSKRGFRPLRVWPAVLFAMLIVAARFGPRLIENGGSQYWMVGVFGPLLCCVLLLIWWLAASRATWRERVFGFLGLAAGAAVVVSLVHSSMRGPGTTYFTLPSGFLLFALAATALRNARPFARTAAAVLLAFAGFAASTLLRTDGMTGDYQFVLFWRWEQTPEEKVLVARTQAATSKAAPEASKVTNSFVNPEWPGFRGADRAARAWAPKIATNWTAQPPQQLWKIPVGPGWSSFALAGRALFTQEQNGPKEAVVCYDAESGREIWRTEVDGRLEDPMGGPGPRATPTLADGGLYAATATGAFMRLDPATGSIVWKKQLTELAGSKVPMWGFSASPLIVGGVAIAYAGGPDGNGLLAFRTDSGELSWSAASSIDCYVSPQLNTLQGENLVLMLTTRGLDVIDPATGKARLNYEWKSPTYRATQPHVTATDAILLPTGMNVGTRAIRLRKNNNELVAEELWTSRNLKPDFVDLVTYRGHIYGNDNGILTCIDAEDGSRKWKGGRYGKGQILLLENSGLLLIAAEQGDVVLVAADPSSHQEVASFKALQGKTWNHPVVAGDRLYVRNSEQAAAYRLPLAKE